jgi:hypothetical protein
MSNSPHESSISETAQLDDIVDEYDADAGQNVEVDQEAEFEESGQFVKFGHGFFSVSSAAIVKAGKASMAVSDGEEIGRLIKFTGQKYWKNLQLKHVYVLGGTSSKSGKEEASAYVIFSLSEGAEETDDNRILRPVSRATMAHFVPIWRAGLEEKYGSDEDALTRILKKYKPVLEAGWADDVGSSTMDPANYPGLFKRVKEKLVSACIPPPTKEAEKARAQAGSSEQGSSSARGQVRSFESAFEGHIGGLVPNGRIYKIGPADSAHAYVQGGVLYVAIV